MQSDPIERPIADEARLRGGTVLVGALLMLIAPNVVTFAASFIRSFAAGAAGQESGFSSPADIQAFSMALLPLSVIVIAATAVGVGFWIGRRTSGSVALAVWGMVAAAAFVNGLSSVLISNPDLGSALANGEADYAALAVGLVLGLSLPVLVEAGLVFFGVWLGRRAARGAEARA